LQVSKSEYENTVSATVEVELSKKYDVMALIEEHEEAVAKHKKRKAKKKRK
jgi:hypothetical protein